MSNCIFCKIINKQIPSAFIYEDDDLVVFSDIAPKAKIHLLLVPKKHLTSIAEMSSDDQELMGKIIYRAKLLAEEEGICHSGYKIIVNTGPDSGQLVPHLHFHLLGGEKLSHLV